MKNAVIPAKAAKRLRTGIQKILFTAWIPAFTGMTLAFQTETPPQTVADSRDDFSLLEAGLAGASKIHQSLKFLAEGKYKEASRALTDDILLRHPWVKSYLDGLIVVSAPLVKYESPHFELFLPEDQIFLKDYALPALEQTAARVETLFGHRPKGKIRVEIYPNKESFSAASTLSLETLERSGAIGICKFHRLMIMSPRSLPLGYRWMDALSHEYMHLIINEITASRAELWFHEGTARYFETAYRLDPPQFLTPDQKTKLITAREEDTLVPFARMSPSMVYLKDQNEVSLAFAQVSHAVGVMVAEGGMETFVRLMKNMKKETFSASFSRIFKRSPEVFEEDWKQALAEEKWEKTKGTMSDEVRFGSVSEDDIVGADAQGQMRLGDRMRQRGLYDGALIEYERALEVEPDNAVILLKAAKTHLALGETDKALARLERAVEKNPNYGTPHYELALLVQGEKALHHLREANAINPFDPRLHKRMADVLGQLGRTSESKRESSVYDQLMR